MKPTKLDAFHSQLALPYLETNQDLLKDIFKVLEQNFSLIKNSKQKFMDLGSGDGRIVIYSALNYGIKSFGIEINQSLIQETKDRIKALKIAKSYDKHLIKRVVIKEGDIFKQNLKEYDFIYIYALPSMHKYLNHVFKTANNDAVIISHKYELNKLESLLKLRYTLEHKPKTLEVSTYLYSKI